MHVGQMSSLPTFAQHPERKTMYKDKKPKDQHVLPEYQVAGTNTTEAQYEQRLRKAKANVRHEHLCANTLESAKQAILDLGLSKAYLVNADIAKERLQWYLDEILRVGDYPTLPDTVPDHKRNVARNHAMTLNQAQLNAVWRSSGDTKIVGPPGTGKTTTIVPIAEARCKEPEECLFLMFNRDTREQVAKKSSSVLQPKKTSKGSMSSSNIKTLDSLWGSLKYVYFGPDNNANNWDLLSKIRKDPDEIRNAKAMVVKEAVVPFRRLRLILVDEAQDVNSLEHTLLWELQRILGVSLVYVGDANQTINHFRGADEQNFNNFCEEGKHALEVNYRSTKQVIRVFNELRPCSDGKVSEEGRPEGVKPQLICGWSYMDVYEHIWSIREKDSEAKILIIGPRKDSLKGVHNTLYKQGVDHVVACDLTKSNNASRDVSGEKNAVKGANIVLDTIHRVKGEERQHVIVLDVDHKYFRCTPSEEMAKRGEMLFFVATSRAIETLTMYTSGDKSASGDKTFRTLQGPCTNELVDVSGQPSFPTDADYQEPQKSCLISVTEIIEGPEELVTMRAKSKEQGYPKDIPAYVKSTEQLFDKPGEFEGNLRTHHKLICGNFVEMLFKAYCDQEKLLDSLKEFVDNVHIEAEENCTFIRLPHGAALTRQQLEKEWKRIDVDSDDKEQKKRAKGVVERLLAKHNTTGKRVYLYVFSSQTCEEEKKKAEKEKTKEKKAQRKEEERERAEKSQHEYMRGALKKMEQCLNNIRQGGNLFDNLFSVAKALYFLDNMWYGIWYEPMTEMQRWLRDYSQHIQQQAEKMRSETTNFAFAVGLPADFRILGEIDLLVDACVVEIKFTDDEDSGRYQALLYEYLLHDSEERRDVTVLNLKQGMKKVFWPTSNRESQEIHNTICKNIAKDSERFGYE